MILRHIVVSLALFASLLFLWNPFDFWMPTELELVIAGALAVIASIYVGIVYKDEGRDEREQALRERAGRYGYLAGVSALTVAIIGSLAIGKHPDPWLLFVLAVMILTRLVSRLRD